MKIFALAIAASLCASAAYAQDTTVIHKEGAFGGKKTTVIRNGEDTGVAVRHKEVIHTGTVGCKSKTVKKTNEMGDTVSKTKSNC